MRNFIYSNYSLLLIWVIISLSIGFYGEFPLNDDWCYSHPVKTLLEENSYEMVWGVTSTLILQVFWGYLFCWVDGEFSFTALRLSTLVAAYIGGVGLFQIIKQLTKLKEVAFWMTIFLIFSPLYFAMSFSFMTDVPFFTLAIWSIYFFLNYLKHDEQKNLTGAIILAILSFFVRQPGAILMLAYGIILLYKRGFVKKSMLEMGILGIAIFSCFYSLDVWIKPYLEIEDSYLPVTDLYLTKLTETPLNFITDLLRRALKSFIYLGLFLAPAWTFMDRKRLALLKKPIWILIVLVANIALLFLLHQSGKIFPFGGNIISNLAIGPQFLSDVFTYGENNVYQLAPWIMYLITLISSCSISFLLIFLWQNIPSLDKEKHIFFLFLLVFNVLYLGAMSINGYFDRYLLIPIASGLIILSPFVPRKKIVAYRFWHFLPLIILAVFAMMGTKDYLNWNDAKTEAKDYLLEEAIPMSKIDAGFEWNGWLNYQKAYQSVEGKSFWWVEDPEYVLTFGPLKGYEAIKQYPYFRNLEWEQRFIYIMKRKE